MKKVVMLLAGLMCAAGLVFAQESGAGEPAAAQEAEAGAEGGQEDAGSGTGNSSEGTFPLGMYVKLALGYTSGGVDFDMKVTMVTPATRLTEETTSTFTLSETIWTKGFEIMPTFGVRLPFFENVDLAAEASLGLAFGGHDYGGFESKTTVINPGLMVLYNYHFPGTMSEVVQRIVPYAGAGFSVPISVVKLDSDSYKDIEGGTSVRFRLNALLGCRYDINDKFSALAEFNTGVIGVFSWSVRAGVIYNIK